MTARDLIRAAVRSGAALAILAGMIEVTIGPQIRSIVGGKADTTRLGIVTLALSSMAFVAALQLGRRDRSSPGATIAICGALAVPGIVCFTTVGSLWLIPGPLLLAGAAGVLATSGHRPGTFLTVLEQQAAMILAGTLAVLYVLLGLTAIAGVGAAGVAGGAIVIGLLVPGRRRRPVVTASMVVVAVLPFSVLAWWSVAVPVVGLLLIIAAFAIVAPARPVRPARV